jgi:hypothetical protein
MRSVPLAAVALLALLGAAPLATPAAADSQPSAALLPFEAPRFCAPTTIRIGSTRFLVSAAIIRTLPGTVPDFDPNPPPADTLVVRIEQVGTRNAPSIFAASALISGQPSASRLSRTQAGLVQEFTSPILTNTAADNSRATILFTTSRGKRTAALSNIPINTYAFPQTTR